MSALQKVPPPFQSMNMGGFLAGLALLAGSGRKGHLNGRQNMGAGTPAGFFLFPVFSFLFPKRVVTFCGLRAFPGSRCMWGMLPFLFLARHWPSRLLCQRPPQPMGTVSLLHLLILHLQVQPTVDGKYSSHTKQNKTKLLLY